MTLLPALDSINEILGPTSRPAVFLDYDGTLTPIVAKPDLAVLSAEVRRVLEDLSKLCPVGILTGRDLEEIRRLVGLRSLHYSGCHGFEILAPWAEEPYRVVADDYPQRVERLTEDLGAAMEAHDGVIVEAKRYSVAVHYRLAARAAVAAIRQDVATVLANHSGFRAGSGKEVIELVPDLDWHKGRALRWILHRLPPCPAAFLPIYIGDDRTDEDAFVQIRESGAGIVVLEGERETAARYRLRDPDAVRTFLKQLVVRLRESGSSR